MDYSLRDRKEEYVYELLDLDRVPIRRLQGVRNCTLEWNVFADIRGKGQLTMFLPERIDWSKYFIRVSIEVSNPSGVERTTLFTGLARIPNERYVEGGIEVDVGLYDATTVLQEHKIGAVVSYPKGTNWATVFAQVIKREPLFERANPVFQGVANWGAASGNTLLTTNPVVWDPATTDSNGGISLLRILNDVCAAVGWYAVFADVGGKLLGLPYVQPKDRPVSWIFADADIIGRQRYSGGLTVEDTVWDSYNDWVFYSRPEGDAAPLKALARNTDPNHPYSVPNLGRVRTEFRSDVEASTQAALQAIVDKAKSEQMLSQRVFTTSVRYVPVVEHQIVRLVNQSSGIDTLASVSGRTLECKPGSKINLTLREL